MASVDAFEARRWLTQTQAAPVAPRPVRPTAPVSFAHALLAILEIRVLLKWRGFHAAHARARTIGPRSEPETPLSRAAEIFLKADTFVPTPKGLEDCLSRSLALYLFLRRAGFAARHCIGVKLYPFAAHAWVETDAAELVLDVRSRVARFRRIAELP